MTADFSSIAGLTACPSTPLPTAVVFGFLLCSAALRVLSFQLCQGHPSPYLTTLWGPARQRIKHPPFGCWATRRGGDLQAPQSDRARLPATQRSEWSRTEMRDREPTGHGANDEQPEQALPLRRCCVRALTGVLDLPLRRRASTPRRLGLPSGPRRNRPSSGEQHGTSR